MECSIIVLDACYCGTYSPRETDSLLLLLVFAASIMGSFIQRGVQLSKAMNIIAATILSIWVVFPVFQFTSPEGASYYLSEGAFFAKSFEALSSYWSHFFWKGSGPILGTLLFGSLFFSLRHWRRTASLLCALLIPLFLISIISKKNVYYAYVIWPVLPLVTGHLLIQMRRA